MQICSTSPNKRLRTFFDNAESLPSPMRQLAPFLGLLMMVTVNCSSLGAQIRNTSSPDSDEDHLQLGSRPYMGWSSWSQESHTFTNNAGDTVGGEAWLTEEQIKTQSDALKSTGLQRHGYRYINIDSGWALSQVNNTDSSSYYDEYGRPLPDLSKFPDGMKNTASDIHRNGQKAGIYWTPGVPKVLTATNPQILNTQYHIQDILVIPYTDGNGFRSSYKIDFTKPGAQAYVDSMVNLFASWGFDFIKLDGVTPGSSISFGPPPPGAPVPCPQNTCIDNTQDVKAWHQAIDNAGRPIWLNLSWSLDHDYVAWWEKYANARRIEFDIECYFCRTTITNWSSVLNRFTDLVLWEGESGPGKGWNDLDSLEVGNGTNTDDGNTLVSGLSEDERRTMMTLWAIANAPLYLGDNLTQLDSFGLELLTNDDVIAVDQSGHPGRQISAGPGGQTPIWVAREGDGAYVVALFNLNPTSANVSVNWSDLGINGGALVFDLWSHARPVKAQSSYSVLLPAHGSSLLRVRPLGE
jgi:alpha-galactosidase